MAPDLDTAIAQLAGPRQVVVQEVRRLAREANFRDKVVRAYDHRCAVTGIQLRLIDAAHILPVGAPGSVDSVQNGLCLSPTYHRAFDHGLIYLDERLVMRLSQHKVTALRALGQVGGLDSFQAPLGNLIFLPPDAAQRPTRDIIRRANQFRRIA
ncbi:MAG TPA: HNH endonuclease [Gemmataceae bacterium]|nr:HNH endonuclease [Gemmataceae bacterium]